MKDNKLITIVELPTFLSRAEPPILSQEEKDELIEYLSRNPEKGDEIRDTGGLRKLRWAGKGKGKRGGLRVIYYFYNDTAPVFLLYVYGKGEQEDLSSQQKKQLTKLAADLKEQCLKRRR